MCVIKKDIKNNFVTKFEKCSYVILKKNIYNMSPIFLWMMILHWKSVIRVNNISLGLSRLQWVELTDNIGENLNGLQEERLAVLLMRAERVVVDLGLLAHLLPHLRAVASLNEVDNRLDQKPIHFDLDSWLKLNSGFCFVYCYFFISKKEWIWSILSIHTKNY